MTIKGSRQDVAEAALRQSAEIFYASHNWQPFFVEGTKTLAYELWEQSGFRAPDNVVVPLGYGSNVLGADARLRRARPRGRDRARGRGSSACRPRAARPTRPPSARASSTSCPTESRPPWPRGSPRPSPRACAEVLRAVRDTGGSIVAVEEAEIVEALRGLARRGLYVEPTSAVAAAGLTRLLATARSGRTSARCWC